MKKEVKSPLGIITNSPFYINLRFEIYLGYNNVIAWVAQLVEHMTENHGVTGSIPVPGTKTMRSIVRAIKNEKHF